MGGSRPGIIGRSLTLGRQKGVKPLIWLPGPMAPSLSPYLTVGLETPCPVSTSNLSSTHVMAPSIPFVSVTRRSPSAGSAPGVIPVVGSGCGPAYDRPLANPTCLDP